MRHEAHEQRGPRLTAIQPFLHTAKKKLKTPRCHVLIFLEKTRQGGPVYARGLSMMDLAGCLFSGLQLMGWRLEAGG